MTQVSRKGFRDKNGEKVILKPIVPGATAGNIPEFDTDGSIKDSGFKTSDFASTDSTRQYEYLKKYIYEQNRSANMVYVSHNGTQAYYKFGDFNFRYLKQDGTTEFREYKNLNDFADKMPAGVNILLPISVSETVNDGAIGHFETVLPALFVQGSDKSWARIYIGNICFSFYNTPVEGVPQYTIDNDGYCTGVGKIYDLTHIFSSDTIYQYKYNQLTTGTFAQAGMDLVNGYTFTPASGESSLYHLVRIGDVIKIKKLTSSSEIEVGVANVRTSNGVQHVQFTESISSTYLGALCVLSKKVPDDNFSKFTNKADKTHHLLDVLNYTSLEDEVQLAIVFGESGAGDKHYILKNNSSSDVTIGDFFSTVGVSVTYSDGLSASTTIPVNAWLAIAIRKVNKTGTISLYMLKEGNSDNFEDIAES